MTLAPDTENILAAYKPISELTLMSQLRYFKDYEAICTLFTHTTEGNQDTITLREDSQYFNGLKVVLKNNDDYYTTVEIPRYQTKTIANLPLPSGGRDTIYWNISTVIRDTDTTKMRLGRGVQFTLTASGNSVQQVYNVTLMKVIGNPL